MADPQVLTTLRAKRDEIEAVIVKLEEELLRAEMARRGMTYAQLAERLAAIGIDENERNLRNKVSRGKFTAGFLLQCLSAIGSQQLCLD